MASGNQPITMNTKKSLGQDDTRFFTNVHLLVGKLVLLMAIHSLGGSCANWHHTANPQPGAAQPTQDEDHTSHEQSTRVPLALRRGKVKNPSQSTRLEPETMTTLRSMILTAPSYLGGGNHQD